MTDHAFTLAAGVGAFGDGSHPTTRGVLAALASIDPVLFTPRMACDIGCGSGIVTLAMAAAFSCSVVAVDISEQAIETMRENASINGVADRVLAVRADGFAHPTIAAQAPYDLMVMNILAEPLLRLAAPADAHLASGGGLLLSGMLSWQESAITEAYGSLGLERTARLTIGNWVTQLWQKQ